LGSVESFDNDLLQLSPGPAGSIFRKLAPGRSDREQIIAGHDVWDMGEKLGIKRIRMIADVNNSRSAIEGVELFGQLLRENKELIKVTQPFTQSLIRGAEDA